jgi:hypothetical protein
MERMVTLKRKRAHPIGDHRSEHKEDKAALVKARLSASTGQQALAMTPV